jgi:hypothetical protein
MEHCGSRWHQPSVDYNHCVETKGRDAAVSAVEKVTGQLFVSDVPDDKIAAALAALSGGKATAKAAPRNRIHDALAGLATSIYGRR